MKYTDVTTKKSTFGKINILTNKFLKEFLKIFWLRPESALWRSVDALFLSKVKKSHPALDLGCGDGCFQFVAQGGKFDLDFDIFSKTDTRDFWKNKDIYDSFDESYKPEITKKPAFVFDVGFDHKENLLKKSAALGIYKKLVVGDANKKLPFKNNSIRYVFSNVLYWVENLDGLMGELNRVLKPGGTLVITVPTDTWNSYRPTYKPEHKTSNKFLLSLLKKLDRGRSNSYFHAYEPRKWEGILEKNGFVVISKKRYLSRRLMIFWDIGLRPFSPLTIKFERLLEFIKIKRYVKFIWIHLFSLVLSRLAVLETAEDKTYPPAFLGIAASKKK